MDKVTYELDGFTELESQLSDLAKGYRSDLVARNTLVKAVKVALVPAFDNVMAAPIPYDAEGNTSGIHLRDTLRIDARIPNEKDKMSEAVMESDSVIGIVSVKKSAVSLSMEFGNARTPAHPFLRMSFQASIPKVLSELKSELSSIIPAYAKKLSRRGIK